MPCILVNNLELIKDSNFKCDINMQAYIYQINYIYLVWRYALSFDIFLRFYEVFNSSNFFNKNTNFIHKNLLLFYLDKLELLLNENLDVLSNLIYLKVQKNIEVNLQMVKDLEFFISSLAFVVLNLF